MTRRSFQRVTLSVELTLPPGAHAKAAQAFLLDALENERDITKSLAPKHGMAGLDLNLAIIKITKRETIYTS